jgi:general secretion pathway protein G
MTSRLRNQSGFTIVELLIVIVVIGILAGLVLNTFNGIQASARDSERKTDLNAVQGHLESYFAKNGYYPTDGNVADATWVSNNLQGLDPEALLDPTSGGAYTYGATPSSCDNSSTECSDFTLSADAEEDGRGVDDADSNTADYVENGQAN